MDWPGIAGLVVAVLTALGLLWERYRGQHRADAESAVEVERTRTTAELEADETTIEQMRRHSKERERLHNADMVKVEKQLAAHQAMILDLMARERECQILAARQDVEIRHLKAEVSELKDELKRSGTISDTSSHEPLKDGK